MRTWLIAVAILFATLHASLAGARNDDPVPLPAATRPADPSAAAQALFARGEEAEARGNYALAASSYRGSVAALPSFRYAAKAITRAALLESHGEGDWAPYRALEAVRRDPEASSNSETIDALAGQADSFPPGPTRGEARMLCAGAYLARLHRRADGERALRGVIDDPHADPLLRREAASELVTALLDDGDLASAHATVLALGPRLDARMGPRVLTRLRRRRIHLASIVDLTLFALLLALAIARAARRGARGDAALAVRKMLPFGLGFAAYVAVGGGLFASSYEAGNAQPFLAFGVAFVPIAFAARAWGAVGSPGRAARASRALLSGSAVLAAAFLMLEAVSALYLEGFNL